MKDVIKLKPTSCGYEEDDNGTAYYSEDCYKSMLRSLISENKVLHTRLEAARQKIKSLKKYIK